MRISGLYMKNWKCFQGEHYLKLEAKAYAIVARLVTDEQRSNGFGKSSLVEAISFALWGRHVFRMEDEFIARGEKSCEVRLEFDDGSVATRGRQLGKTTVLTFLSDGRESRGREAQEEIIRRIGLDERDFVATCSFEQRQIARFILARPEERMEIVSGWVGLEPLERAEALARTRASDLADESSSISSAIEASKQVERDAVGDLVEDGLATKIVDLEERLLGSRAVRDAARADRVAANAVEKLFEDADRYDRLVEDGKKIAGDEATLRSKVESLDVAGIEETYRAAVAARADADKEVRSRSVVAHGQFDGKCPVAEIACPVRQQINLGRSEAQAALDAARSRQGDVAQAERTASAQSRDVNAGLLDLREAETKLEQARKRALELRPSKKKIKGMERPDLVALHQLEVDVQEDVVELERELAGFRQRAMSAERARASRVELDERQQDVDGRLATAQEAVKIFGKNGAQRCVAEGALGQIEDTANSMLSDAGIDLSVGIRWSREGRGLATACETCGWAFPASTKVKACGRCREERGPKLVHALDFVLSWRSGAAENLSGLFVQLAASSWLRAARGSTWAVALLDEPTDALDRVHRHAIMQAMLGAMSACRFEQSFLVSHSHDVVDVLPGRIEIVSDGVRSTVRVVA